MDVYWRRSPLSLADGRKVNRKGTTARVIDAPLDEVLDEEWFFTQLCEVPQQVSD